MKLHELDTPSLIVDLDLFEHNCATMQAYLAAQPFTLRAHTKAHKIPELAKRQIAYGSHGICTAKLGEAEVMAAAGLDDILITTPIASAQKVERLIAIQQQHPQARIIQVVDHSEHVQAIGAAARKAQCTIELLVEVECGQQRCGVQPGTELVQLARLIESTDGVSYAGVQAYTGHLQHIVGFTDRCAAARDAVAPVFRSIDKDLAPSGLAPRIVSGGGTSTYAAYEDLPFTEIQAGSYIFMDAAYQKIGSADGAAQYTDFACALNVWSTIISRPTPQRAVIDAGMKALSIDSGMPLLVGQENIQYTSGGDEHGILHLPEDSNNTMMIGERVLLIPSHCDTTLNQFNTLYGIRGDTVESEWQIAGRGRSD